MPTYFLESFLPRFFIPNPELLTGEIKGTKNKWLNKEEKKEESSEKNASKSL